MREIKAIFTIQGDVNITGVYFECDGKRIVWDDMTLREKVRMLNAWANHYKLFSKFAK